MSANVRLLGVMIFMGGDPVARVYRMRSELESLRAEYAGFTISIIGARDRPRFEAVRATGDETVSVVITDDAAELRQILDAALAAEPTDFPAGF